LRASAALGSCALEKIRFAMYRPQPAQPAASVSSTRGHRCDPTQRNRPNALRYMLFRFDAAPLPSSPQISHWTTGRPQPRSRQGQKGRRTEPPAISASGSTDLVSSQNCVCVNNTQLEHSNETSIPAYWLWSSFLDAGARLIPLTRNHIQVRGGPPASQAKTARSALPHSA